MTTVLDLMLPYWGDPKYLYAAVESIRAQDRGGWRLTVVDDQYPSDEVPKYFENLHDDRVRYLRNEKNLGITDNYRHCLSLAEADYVVFMGCDDIMAPGYVSSVLAAIERFGDVEIFQPGCNVIDAEGRVYTPLADRIKNAIRPRSNAPLLLAGESLAVSLLHGDWLYWPSIVFKTSAIKQVDFLDGYPLVQDLGIILEMIRRGARMVVLPEVVFSYRRHQASASSATLMDGKRFAGERSFFKLQATKMAQVGWRRAAWAARCHLTSRAYAVTLLSKAFRVPDFKAVRTLVQHAIGSK